MPAIYVATRLIGLLRPRWSVSLDHMEDDLIVLRISAAGAPDARPVEQAVAEMRTQFEAEANWGWKLESA